MTILHLLGVPTFNSSSIRFTLCPKDLSARFHTTAGGVEILYQMKSALERKFILKATQNKVDVKDKIHPEI